MSVSEECGGVSKRSEIFFSDNALRNDACAQNTRERDNLDIYSYNLFNFYGDCERGQTELNAFAAQHPNLKFKNGYGNTNSCTVDKDSKARLVCLSHGPEKRQLDVRSFTAVPDMSRGCLIPDTESYLLNGQDTTYFRECNRTAEKSYDRFIPLLDCMQDYVNGYAVRDYFPRGADSRQVVRDYLHEAKCTSGR